jgi:hypothetical protein
MNKIYAKLDSNNIVLNCMHVSEQDALTPELGKKFLQNLLKYENIVYSNTSHPSTTAVIGRKWYPEEGIFKNEKPYDSWIWSNEQWNWVAPVPPPEDSTEIHEWDENIKTWVVKVD